MPRSRCLTEVSLKLGLLPGRVYLDSFLVVTCSGVTRFDFSFEIAEIIYVASQYTLLINFQEGTAEMEEKVPRDLEGLRDQKVIKLTNVNVTNTFLVTQSVASIVSYNALRCFFLKLYR